jgi:hypothetical protein
METGGKGRRMKIEEGKKIKSRRKKRYIANVIM